MYYYILIVWNDVEPEFYGPWKTEGFRDYQAKKLRTKHGPYHGIFPIDSESNKLSVSSYSGEYMEDATERYHTK